MWAPQSLSLTMGRCYNQAELDMKMSVYEALKTMLLILFKVHRSFNTLTIGQPCGDAVTNLMGVRRFCSTMIFSWRL